MPAKPVRNRKMTELASIMKTTPDRVEAHLCILELLMPCQPCEETGYENGNYYFDRTCPACKGTGLEPVSLKNIDHVLTNVQRFMISAQYPWNKEFRHYQRNLPIIKRYDDKLNFRKRQRPERKQEANKRQLRGTA